MWIVGGVCGREDKRLIGDRSSPDFSIALLRGECIGNLCLKVHLIGFRN